MNILDENILAAQREQLRTWGISVRQIGIEVGYKGIQDADIIPLLHKLRQPTFFTRDANFYKLHLCHARYVLVYLDIEKSQSADFIRRVLRHHDFNTRTKRMGLVIRAAPSGLTVWRLHIAQEIAVGWPA